MLNIITICDKPLHIFGAIVDAVVDFRVRQPAAIPKRLQHAGTNLQRMADILIIHPLAHTPATTLAIDAIHSLTNCPRCDTSSSKVFFSMLIISITISYLH